MSIVTTYPDAVRKIVEDARRKGCEVVVKQDGNHFHVEQINVFTSDQHIDGHFWVTHQGKIYDVTSAEHVERMKRVGHRAVYLPAPEPHAENFIKKVIGDLRRNTEMRGGCWEDNITVNQMRYENGMLSGFDCVQGALVLKRMLGDEAKICYGQFGSLKPDGMIYWFFGHPHEPPSIWQKKKGEQEFIDTETHSSTHPTLIYDPRTPEIVKPPKQKPNDKCACRCGKKYKMCCGRLIK